MISASVSYLITSTFRPESIEYVTVPKPVEVMPPLPECANFDFNPDVGGMLGDEFVIYTAELWQWGAGCSNAVYEVQKNLN